MADKENVATLIAKEEKQKNKDNGQAKNAILQFLTELGINRIIYIDDRCSIQELKEAFIGKLKALYSTKPKELDFVNWESPQPVFESEINTKWDEEEDQERRKLFLSVLKFENNQEELENSVAPLKLKEHLGDKIDLLSPTEWVSKKDEIVAELTATSKILFLFDIEFKHAPLHDGRDGRDLAVELLSTEAINGFVYCGIFSHLFDVDNETEKRNEYCTTHNLEKEKFYTISKKRFQNDSYLPGLAEGIRNTLLINEVEYLKKEASKILRKSFKDSLNEIEDLNPDSFNHIIQKSSRKEGIWEMATLIRINNIVTKDKALNTLLSKPKRTNINKSLAHIRKVEKIKTGGETPFDKTQIQKLRHKELYIENSILNQLHFPISNGDIFRINNKDFILLGQPCNLALRSNGKRDIGRGKTYETGFLLEIESVSKEAFNKLKGGQLSTIGLLENSDIVSESYSIVRFPMFQTVSLSPLDLTVFNADGKAIINLNKLENDSSIIQESWKLRYKKLHEIFLEYRDNISTFKKLKSSNKDNLRSLIYYGEIFKNYDINNENVLNHSGNKITIDIQRTSYYREPYSSDLLQKFMQYLSRNAFDRDFLNG
jgi:hypothetical protein